MLRQLHRMTWTMSRRGGLGGGGGRTLEQALDLPQLGSIVELPEVLGLLRQVLALDGRVALVGDDLGSGAVEVRDHRGHVDVCRPVRIAALLRTHGTVHLGTGKLLTYSSMTRWHAGTCSRSPGHQEQHQQPQKPQHPQPPLLRAERLSCSIRP